MKRALLLRLGALSFHRPCPPRAPALFNRNLLRVPPSPASSNFNLLRFLSSESDAGSSSNSSSSSSDTKTDPPPESSSAKIKPNVAVVEDVSNKEFKRLLEKYFEGDQQILPTIFEAVMKRQMSRKHEETDDELLQELHNRPFDDVSDEEFLADFDATHSTDEEIDNLYSIKEQVMKKMASDEYFNLDEKKWDKIVNDLVENGQIRDTRACEATLEDMLKWDNLLPDEAKQKISEKYNELSDLVEKGVHTAEEGHHLLKEFEDQLLMEHAQTLSPPQDGEINWLDNKDLDDPPGEGPILRWETRVVFSPGGDQWHPKNRKVKMGVTVKELKLSKYQFRRLRALVGKRYDPGKDELMITSERFEHREENRKDCLRTVLSLLEEARKADKMVEAARISYVKGRLQANPAFMERLSAKTKSLRADPAFMERWRAKKLEGSNPALAP